MLPVPKAFRKKRLLKEFAFKNCFGQNCNSRAVSDEPNIFEGKYYNIVVIILRIVELWPYPHPQRNSSLRTLLPRILYYLLTATFLIPQILSVTRGDMYDMLNYLPIIFYHVVCMTKYTEILKNRLKIKELCDTIQEDWKEIKEGEREILRISYNLVYYIRNAYMGFISTAWAVFHLLQYFPLIAEPFFGIRDGINLRVFKNSGDYVFDLGSNGDAVRSSHLVVVTFINTFLMAGVDNFFLLTVAHTCALFRILSRRISDIIKESKDKSKEIRQLVVFHRKILKNVVLLQNMVSYSIIIVEGLSLTVLPVALFTIYNGAKHPIIAFECALFFGGFILEIFIFNAAGQRMIDTSNMIYESLYFSDWYNLPVEFQQIFGLMLVRSLHSSKITAGKLTTLSLPTFLTIIQTIFSYYTVLVSVF